MGSPSGGDRPRCGAVLCKNTTAPQLCEAIQRDLANLREPPGSEVANPGNNFASALNGPP